jgi:hypothetical protein
VVRLLRDAEEDGADDALAPAPTGWREQALATFPHLTRRVAQRIEAAAWSVALGWATYPARLRNAGRAPTRDRRGRPPKTASAKQLEDGMRFAARGMLHQLQLERRVHKWRYPRTAKDLTDLFFEALADHFEKAGARRRRGKGTHEATIRAVKERVYPSRRKIGKGI